MRLKSKDTEGRAKGFRQVTRFAQNDVVTPMYPVEIPDSNRSAPKLLWRVTASENLHGAGI